MNTIGKQYVHTTRAAGVTGVQQGVGRSRPVGSVAAQPVAGR
ncbi:hypothetical protein [Nocardia miyunensis]|nr:hypothetical protein [Nocardia miyunensis]